MLGIYGGYHEDTRVCSYRAGMYPVALGNTAVSCDRTDRKQDPP